MNDRKVLDEYQARTPRSRRLSEHASGVIPGGRTRASVFFDPYPFYAERGSGSRVWDVDGNERIDFLNNYTSLVHGHRHPAVVRAAREQLERGNVFGAPTAREAELAELLCARVASFEQVILTTTGTEAIVAAVRAARSLTGRHAIAKAEGGFHGTYDHVNVSVTPDPGRWGDYEAPEPVVDSAGVPPRVRDEVFVFHYNDADSCNRVVEQGNDVLAAIILEPVLGPGGMIPPVPGFLEAVRAAASRSGALLIFDEVFAHRLAPGGAQEFFGVQADLVAISKSIGSGFPVGAVGGGREVMAAFGKPESGRQSPLAGGRSKVFLSGTFHGNPLSAAAAVATLTELSQDAYIHLSLLGDRVRRELEDVFARHSVPASVTGAGSLFQIHFRSGAPRNYRDVVTANRATARELHLALLNRGIILGPTGLGCLSTASTDQDVDDLLAAVDDITPTLTL